jgi:hypothetical protein
MEMRIVPAMKTRNEPAAAAVSPNTTSPLASTDHSIEPNRITIRTMTNAVTKTLSRIASRT